MRIGSVMRPLSQAGRRLLNANRIESLQHFDACTSIYFRPDRFRYGRSGHLLLTNTRVLRDNPNASPLSENNTYLVSRVTSCDILTEVKATRGKRFKLQVTKLSHKIVFISNVCRKLSKDREIS